MNFKKLNAVSILVSCCLLSVLNPQSAIRAQEFDFIYWAANDDGEIWRVRTDGSNARRMLASGQVGNVVVDPATDSIYYSWLDAETSEEAIYRADTKGENRVLLIDGIDRIWDLDLDPVAGKLYWAEVGTDEVHRMDLDGSNAEMLLTGMGGIGLDLVAGKIYFGRGAEIWRADLDGASPELFLTENSVIDIEIDPAGGKIYMTKGDPNQGLTQCDLAGTNCLILVDDGICGSLEIFGDEIYFMKSTQVWKSGLDGSDPTQLSSGRDLNQEAAFDVAAGIVLTGSGSMIQADLDGTSRTGLVAAVRNTHSVSVDPANGRFYYASTRNEPLSVSPIARPRPRPLTADYEKNDEARGSALDQSGGRLYWVNMDTPPDGGIWSIGFDESVGTEIVTNLDKPHDVAVDEAAGKIYWIDSISGSNGVGGVIRRADRDGMNVEDVLTDLSRGIRGLAVDPQGGKVYWTDHVADTVSRADLNGENVEVVLSGLEDPHDLALDLSAGVLYWSGGVQDNGPSTGLIGTSNLDGTSASIVISGISSQIRDIAFATHLDFIFADDFEEGATNAWTTTISSSVAP